MKKYLQILKFSLINRLAYPADFLIEFVNGVLSAVFITVFWYVVKGNSNLGIKSIPAYFIITTGISTIFLVHSQKFGAKLRRAIKSGEFNNYLIKPINTVLTMYFETIGHSVVTIVMGLLMIVTGIIILGNFNPIQLFLFSISCVPALILGFCFNWFEGVATFYVTEPDGFMNMLSHIAKLASGFWIPLSYFPKFIQNALYFSPFAGMIYIPYKTLEQTSINLEILLLIASSFVWAIFITALLNFFWQKGLRKYEAVGI